MVDAKSVQAQLKRIKFDASLWGRAEANELQHILLPDEKIYECVNGIYEGGFALLVATNIRVLLVDKKPMNFLNVEDMRFDMINELDYNHRLLGAMIRIDAGNKTLRFRSYNQQRLRKLLGHVQHRMAEIKQEQTEHAEYQKRHLEEINKQLQAYLLAQYEQQMRMHQQLQQGSGPMEPQPLKPSPQLSDYLFAQSLLAQQKQEEKPDEMPHVGDPEKAMQEVKQQQEEAKEFIAAQTVTNPRSEEFLQDLVDEGRKEIFGDHAAASQPTVEETSPLESYLDGEDSSGHKIDLRQLAARSLEVNPLKIAYAKLPLMLHRRRLNSQAQVASQQWHSKTAPQDGGIPAAA